MRWFERNMEEGVHVENVSSRRIGFQIAGPNARELLRRTTRADVSADAFRFMDAREMDVGLCRALVQRVSYTGDLGYEIYVDICDQRALYAALAEAGADLGLKPFGMRAMMSLRLEKFFGAWLREFGPDYTPLETGMDRFTAYNKPVDFIGKAAAAAEKAAGAARKLCAFVVEADDADVVAYEPIWVGGKVVGFVTSGGYAHHARKSVALGFVPVEMARDGLEVEIEILGDMRKARLVTTPLFDADNARMRGWPACTARQPRPALSPWRRTSPEWLVASHGAPSIHRFRALESHPAPTTSAWFAGKSRLAPRSAEAGRISCASTETIIAASKSVAIISARMSSAGAKTFRSPDRIALNEGLTLASNPAYRVPIRTRGRNGCKISSPPVPVATRRNPAPRRRQPVDRRAEGRDGRGFRHNASRPDAQPDPAPARSRPVVAAGRRRALDAAGRVAGKLYARIVLSRPALPDLPHPVAGLSGASG
jgi:hypothetical protein